MQNNWNFFYRSNHSYLVHNIWILKILKYFSWVRYKWKFLIVFGPVNFGVMAVVHKGYFKRYTSRKNFYDNEMTVSDVTTNGLNYTLVHFLEKLHNAVITQNAIKTPAMLLNYIKDKYTIRNKARNLIKDYRPDLTWRDLTWPIPDLTDCIFKFNCPEDLIREYQTV